MGFVKSLFGGGNGGSDAKAAEIVKPATVDQANASYNQTQTGLQQQQAFLQALAAQNGIGNQADVYNQLGQVANGTGPNPAQTALAMNTEANTANQAAMMAGQRGVSANPALIARQIAMQGSANQQNAVLGAANMQANQQLNAMNAMGNIAGQQVNNLGNANNAYSQAAQGQQNNILNSINNQNNAGVQMQGNINNANAGIANQRNAGQANLFGNLVGAAGTVLGSVYGGPAGGVAGGMAGKAAGSSLGGTANGNMPMAATGGEIVKGPKSSVGKHLCMADGGKVAVLLSPGEKVLNPNQAKEVAAGKAKPMAEGKEVPGKAKVAGAKNSYANDTHKDALEEGSIVIPRSITKGKDAEKNAAAFVKAVLAHGLKK